MDDESSEIIGQVISLNVKLDYRMKFLPQTESKTRKSLVIMEPIEKKPITPVIIKNNLKMWKKHLTRRAYEISSNSFLHMIEKCPVHGFY